MLQTLISTGEPQKPELEQLPLGIGAHGDTVDIRRSRTVGWITGTGKVLDAKAPLAPGQRWPAQITSRASAFEGRKADLVQVQLNLGYILTKNAERRAITEESVAGYVAATKSAGATLVFCVVPGNQHTTHKPGANKGELVKKAEADFLPELHAMDAECRRLSKTYGAVMAPTHLTFAALRTAHPELDRPIHGTDTHWWPHDAVLAALVISRAFLGEGEHPLPTPEVLLAPLNQQITQENRKRKAKGEAEKPLISIDAATWRAMLEATTATFAAPRTRKAIHEHSRKSDRCRVNRVRQLTQQNRKATHA
jgi:hypothetical protein